MTDQTSRSAPESRGVALIAAERLRQVEVEGWTPEHDAGHDDGELALAAATYAIPHEGRQAHIWMENNNGQNLSRQIVAYLTWPRRWTNSWKPTPNNRIRELVKAGALIAAEIDRLHTADSGGLQSLPDSAASPVPEEQP